MGREQLLRVRKQVWLSSEKSRLVESESHWPRSAILVGKYGASVGALHSHVPSIARAPGHLPRRDPRGLFEALHSFLVVKVHFLVSLLPSRFEWLWRASLLQSLQRYSEKVPTRSGSKAKSNFEYRSVCVHEFRRFQCHFNHISVLIWRQVQYLYKNYTIFWLL